MTTHLSPNGMEPLGANWVVLMTPWLMVESLVLQLMPMVIYMLQLALLMVIIVMANTM